MTLPESDRRTFLAAGAAVSLGGLLPIVTAAAESPQLQTPGRRRDSASPMRILIVNANTSALVTEKLEAEARAVASPGTEIVAVTGTFGARVIASRAENAIAEHSAIALIPVRGRLRRGRHRCVVRHRIARCPRAVADSRRRHDRSRAAHRVYARRAHRHDYVRTTIAAALSGGRRRVCSQCTHCRMARARKHCRIPARGSRRARSRDRQCRPVAGGRRHGGGGDIDGCGDGGRAAPIAGRRPGAADRLRGVRRATGGAARAPRVAKGARWQLRTSPGRELVGVSAAITRAFAAAESRR